MKQEKYIVRSYVDKGEIRHECNGKEVYLHTFDRNSIKGMMIRHQHNMLKTTDLESITSTGVASSK